MAKTTVPSQYIADNAVTTAKIAANAITAAQIAGGAIVSVDLGDNSITVASIAGNAVGSSEIAANAVGNSEIAANAVDSAEIVSGSIDTAHLSADAVDGTKIADDSIDSEHYVDGSIDTAHIGDSQVTNAKLANSSVTVNSNSLSLGGTLTLDTDDIGEGSTNQYFTNARAQSAISAGTGITVSSGEISIAGNAITATMIAANAVGSSEIAANSVDSAEIAANAVSTSELASTAAPTFASITTTGNGDIGGNLTVTGNLQVDGTTTTINSTNLSVDDLNITVAAGAANAAAANGAGLTVDGANATFTYDSTNDEWDFNKDIHPTGVNLSDDEYLTLGSSGEFQIVNDGTNSIIRSSDNLLIQRNTTPRSAISIIDSSGEVQLHYGGSEKLSTTSAGITVTGTIIATSNISTQAGSAGAGINIQRTNSSTSGARGYIGFRDSDGNYVASIDSRATGVNNSGDLRFTTSTGEAETGVYNLTPVLTLGTDQSATFAGTVTLDNLASIQGLDTGNPSASTDEIRVSGYGILGNRGTFYITNGGGSVQIGNGSTHNASSTAVFDTTGLNMSSGKTIRMNGSTKIDASGNLINIGTISSGAITSSGNLHAGDGTDISMDASANGQLEVDGNGYQGAIALNATGMHLYHNSGSRNLTLGTNETARIIIGATGGVSFNNNNLTSVGTISSSNIVVTTSSVGEVGLEIRRSAALGRAQLTIADESGNDLWRIGATGPGSEDFAFFDGGANVLTLLKSSDTAQVLGKVLIGTDSGDSFNSNASLRVQSSSHDYLQIKCGTTAQGGVLIGDVDDDFVGGFIYSNSTNALTLYSNNSAAVVFDSNRVANFTSGTSKVASFSSNATQSSGFNDIVEFLAGSQTGGGVSVNFGIANSTKNVGKVVFNYSGTSGSDSNYLSLGFFDADHRMKIFPTGDVRITDGGSIRLWDSNGTTGDGSVHIPRGGHITFYGNESAAHSIGSRNSAGAIADDLRINSYGAVYIDLDSNSNNSSTADFVIGRHGGQGTGTSTEIFRISGEGNGAGAIITQGENHEFRYSNAGIYFTNGSSSPSYSNHGGIGRAAGTNFHVTGSTAGDLCICAESGKHIMFGDANTQNARLEDNGNFIAAGSVTGSSDVRLKDNVQTIQNALEKTIALRGVTFTRNDIEDSPEKIGVVAQEVEPILPQVVITAEDEDAYKSVAYGEMVALLIEAIKELKTENDNLKSRIEVLEE